jgi:hypothetical protein
MVGRAMVPAKKKKLKIKRVFLLKVSLAALHNVFDLAECNRSRHFSAFCQAIELSRAA